jgi:hypothetical protein
MKFTTIQNARQETGLSYLGNINSSAKMIKNKKVSGQYTYIIYLAPAKTSGYQVCSHSTPECRLGCLATSGRSGMELSAGKSRIKDARVKKTRMFFEHQEYFMNWMIAEIRFYQRKAQKDGFSFSARLNGTADIDWQNVRINGQNIFEIFPEVSFYDYTKNPLKFRNKASNYHLTFSHTGRNWNLCKAVLESGNNVAVVFNAKNESELPAMYKGYKVINGDANDYRPLDGQGVIVGLKWKRIANKVVEKEMLQSCFVVQPNDINCQNIIVHEKELVLN